MSAGLKLKQVKKAYGSVQVLHGIDLDIKSGEFVVFVGPSGCGKSTLLRLIAGLEDITEGTLEIGNTVVNTLPPSKRGIAMVFQSYALYPHMTVYENMAFGLKLAKASHGEQDRRVREAAEMLQITPISTAFPSSFPAANVSASPSAEPSSATPRCSCSTNLSPTSTRRCALRRAWRSPSSTSEWPIPP